MVVASTTLISENGLGLLARLLAVSGLLGIALRRRSLTFWILVSVAIGVELGYDFPRLAQGCRFLSEIFLDLIRVVIAPLLCGTLVVGIARHSNIQQVGRMGLKLLIYFEVVTTVAMVIGLVGSNAVRPGQDIRQPSIVKQSIPPAPRESAADFIADAFPANIVRSMAEDKTLQIVVFSILFGIAVSGLPEASRAPILTFAESLSDAMFRFTNMIMYAAPVGVGAAMAYIIGTMGLGVLSGVLKLVLTLYGTLLSFVLLILLPIALLVRVPLRKFIQAIAEPVSIAFATSSSEAALPLAMEAMEHLGIPRHIVSFVTPVGYAFNLAGSALYLAAASVFVAQAGEMHLSFGQQIVIVLSLILASKGMAGVPRASLIVLTATAATFNMPQWPILVLAGIDTLLDMPRTAVNVMGNCLATVVIARWEGETAYREAVVDAPSQ
jgi:Na+/H+-dicarboxylate symporter